MDEWIENLTYYEYPTHCTIHSRFIIVDSGVTILNLPVASMRTEGISVKFEGNPFSINPHISKKPEEVYGK